MRMTHDVWRGDDQLLDGRSILIVEDQFLVAEELSSLVRHFGGTVMGPVASTAEALDLIRGRAPSLALLDVDLDGDRVYAVAHALREARIPFAFTTGFAAAAIEPDFGDVPHLEKPIVPALLRRALHDLTAAKAPAPR